MSSNDGCIIYMRHNILHHCVSVVIIHTMLGIDSTISAEKHGTIREVSTPLSEEL